MNRLLLMLLLVVDLVALAAGVFIVIDRVQKNSISAANPFATVSPAGRVEAPAQKTEAPVMTSTGTEAQIIQSTSSAAEELPQIRPGPPKRVTFRYRDSVPRRVSVIGEFNEWSPQLLKKDANHNWTLSLKIPPGRYAYNLIVDGKMIRDPSNKKIVKAGQKIPSSLLIIQGK